MVGDEGEARAVGTDMRLTRGFDEVLPRPGRKVQIAIQVGVDLGQHQLVGMRQRLRVELRAADDEDPCFAADPLQRGIQAVGGFGAGASSRHCG